ncbi:hypothetical protein KIN20_001684 [Parelaphostrongylus tenuis]|uniref:Uncharacterized protein n=1 Tax=Parelaphostrongylus tenuis TaxID=148309 RepID=A0AAD5MMI1_PARTN|nr:hypothetical protein KIN20_001684 [Parelaphostrongylus tenuis]
MLAYVKMRMEDEEMTKCEILYRLYVKQVDGCPDGSSVTGLRHIKHLMQQWISMVYGNDPQPTPNKKKAKKKKLRNDFAESLVRTPRKNPDEVGRSLPADTFDPQWMMTDEEKRTAEMQATNSLSLPFYHIQQ